MGSWYGELLARIDGLFAGRERVLVAIDGNSGAGKSSLAGMLGVVYDCNVFHMDDFFLQPFQRTRERLGQPGGNVDHERFLAEVLGGLETGKPFRYRIFDCRTMAFGGEVLVRPKALNIVEGCYSMHPALGQPYDLKVFLQVPKDVQMERILARSGPVLGRRFREEWIPMEDAYFRAMDIPAGCDLVIDGTERN
ncbi:uridine kinase family protein [Anaerotalea alkaliphila]|uniref:Uridine kinase n=1 Tax=Anaerotalea alkaliphila TaxID=2662126 RepID=A0A7X5HU04_9FIRM|nr:hypothetical protein [Anaerotalea alkaliphila]NDL66642.1 hypothetical protein [Anaerotalea alkaliphila]